MDNHLISERKPNAPHSYLGIRFDWLHLGVSRPGRIEGTCKRTRLSLCAKADLPQLANTFQEDADFLGAWYSGWYNGLAKKNVINIPRAKEGIHQVIVYCKANPDKKIIQAIDFVLKQEKKNKE